MTEPMDMTVSTTVMAIVLTTLHVINIQDIVTKGVALDTEIVTAAKVYSKSIYRQYQMKKGT